MTDLELALHLADVADEMSMLAFRDPTIDLAVVTKPDGSRVTRFDVDIEVRLRAVLAEHRPDDAILGEEQGASGGGTRRWVIDPIDGTSAFIVRRPDWATLIALEVDGVAQVGVVSMPSIGARWWGSPGGAARAVSGGAPEALVASHPRTGRSAGWPPLDDVADAFRSVVASRTAGMTSVPRSDWTTYPALGLLAGEFDVSYHEGCEWDVAALDAVARSGGGAVERFVDGDRHLLVVAAPGDAGGRQSDT